MKKKLSLISLGCNKNQVESEVILSLLKEKFEIVGNLSQAEVIVIAPCAFLKSARLEAKREIENLVYYKNNYKCKCLVVTGCLAELYNKNLADINSAVDLVIGASCINDLSDIISSYFLGVNKKAYFKTLSNKNNTINNKRLIPISSSSYVKIADGCDNLCSYCLIPTIKGGFKSRKELDIIDEIKLLVSSGIKEINILGQDIGSYGIDIYGESRLFDLVKKILRIKELKWLRLQYMHPASFDERILDLMENNNKLCKYLDIPLQHINRDILNFMGRKITKDKICKLINRIRNKVPSIVLRTTFIVGFPGETKKIFSELLSFIKKYKIEKVGVFRYSKEKGTEAFKLKKHISYKEKKNREKTLLITQKLISYNINRKFTGQVFDVLAETIIDGTYIGRTEFMAPVVDGHVYFKSKKIIKLGSFVKVYIEDSDSYDLFGYVL